MKCTTDIWSKSGRQLVRRRLQGLLSLYMPLIFGGCHIVCCFEQALEVAGVLKARYLGNGLYGIIGMLLQFCQGMFQSQICEILREGHVGVLL